MHPSIVDGLCDLRAYAVRHPCINSRSSRLLPWRSDARQERSYDDTQSVDEDIFSLKPATKDKVFAILDGHPQSNCATKNKNASPARSDGPGTEVSNCQEDKQVPQSVEAATGVQHLFLFPRKEGADHNCASHHDSQSER